MDEFKNKYYIDILINTLAIKIDPTENQIIAIYSNSKNKMKFEYDSLIIATAARALIPKIKGLDANNKNGIKNAFFLRNLEDGITIQNNLENVKSSIIIGSGLIGIEMVE